MDSVEAGRLVEVIRDSIIQDPGQFNISVNVTGQKVVGGGGGTALSITATGGAPGSTTIGQKLSVSGGQIEIARQQGIAAMNQQLQALVDELGGIAGQLKSDKPDRGLIANLYQNIKNGSWVPGVITSVIGSILTASLGALG